MRQGVLSPQLSEDRTAHLLDSVRQGGILFLYLDLGPRRLGVRDGVNELALGPSQICRALKILERLGDLALLQEQLRHSGNSDIAVGVDLVEKSQHHKQHGRSGGGGSY